MLPKLPNVSTPQVKKASINPKPDSIPSKPKIDTGAAKLAQNTLAEKPTLLDNPDSGFKSTLASQLRASNARSKIEMEASKAKFEQVAENLFLGSATGAKIIAAGILLGSGGSFAGMASMVKEAVDGVQAFKKASSSSKEKEEEFLKTLSKDFSSKLDPSSASARKFINDSLRDSDLSDPDALYAMIAEKSTKATIKTTEFTGPFKQDSQVEIFQKLLENNFSSLIELQTEKQRKG